MSEAQDIASGVMKGFEQFVEREMRRGQQDSRPYVYASSWRRCTRQMALEMITPKSLKPFETNTLANFRRGKDRERDLLADLSRAGRDSTPPFEIIGHEERFELRDHKGRIAIVGKVDARLKIGRLSAPLEVKSWNVNLTARVKTFEDLFENRWTRSGAHQLLSYMLATNQPVGFMLLDRNGLPMILEVELDKHLDRIEDFLARAELAMDSKEVIDALKDRVSVTDTQELLPPFIDDPAECRMCGFFGSVCNPPMKYPGAQIITDEETIQLTERYADLQAMPEIDEFDTLDKWAKERFRGITVPTVVGKCMVSGKWQKDTKYKLSAEAKKQIEAIKEPFARPVAEGKYFLEVTKVDQ